MVQAGQVWMFAWIPDVAPWINYGDKYLFMVSINKNNFGLNFNLRFTIAVYKVHIYMRDGCTSKKRSKKLLSVSLYTAFFGFQMI